jgi:hypothetical protein
MAKTKISEFDPNPANNTDIDGINIAEGMAPGLVNNAFRELMAQLKDFQAGTAGDNLGVGGNLTVTGTTTLTGTTTIAGAATLAGRAIDAFPTGTRMLFQQTAAPTGWTKVTTEDNKALRVVSGTAGTGGSVNFTTAFSSKSVSGTIGNTTATNQATTAGGTVGNHTLTIAEIPSHTHVYADTTAAYQPLGGGNQSVFRGPAAETLATGGSGAHNHTFSGSSHNHTQNAHNHTFTGTAIDLAVQYVDVIIATKN